MFFEPPLLASAPPIEIPASEQLYTIPISQLYTQFLKISTFAIIYYIIADYICIKLTSVPPST